MKRGAGSVDDLKALLDHWGITINRFGDMKE